MEGGHESPRVDSTLLQALKDRLTLTEKSLQQANSQVEVGDKQNLILKQINYFNQRLEQKKDSEIYSMNLLLQEEVRAKDNTIRAMSD